MDLELIHYATIGILVLAPVLLLIDVPWTEPARQRRVGLAASRVGIMCPGNSQLMCITLIITMDTTKSTIVILGGENTVTWHTQRVV